MLCTSSLLTFPWPGGFSARVVARERRSDTVSQWFTVPWWGTTLKMLVHPPTGVGQGNPFQTWPLFSGMKVGSPRWTEWAACAWAAAFFPMGFWFCLHLGFANKTQLTKLTSKHTSMFVGLIDTHFTVWRIPLPVIWKVTPLCLTCVYKVEMSIFPSSTPEGWGGDYGDNSHKAIWASYGKVFLGYKLLSALPLFCGLKLQCEKGGT